MNIGIILECQREGPDEKVIRHLLREHCREVNAEIIGLSNKKDLVSECGITCKRLIKDGAERVIILWDLYPAEWGDTLSRKYRQPPCRHNDKVRIHKKLEENGVDANLVHLVAIEYMLETWLLADTRAIATFLSAKCKREITPRQLGSVNPRTEPKPKDRLSKMYSTVTSDIYRDHSDAARIAALIEDLTQLKKVPSFKRFWGRVTATEI